MTAAMIKAWCEVGADEIAQAAGSPAVQQPAAMQQGLAARLERLHGIADILYGRWIQGLRA
jgi:hypothetical protein